MVACEEFLTFVQMTGGPSGMTVAERRRIMAYQKLIQALMSQHVDTQEEHKRAA